ncbi:Transcription initiation factor IIB [Orchesella cincta]|uniref:Transcription initiation factor IIB n=1 Tax=Orchesella cincta TaxID=48709 RepID=A0A1D2M4R8_ORCCI|nr:Transcription initiation factor IIB [Orchesella cincta]
MDVGSEWRTSTNEATGADPCLVGGAENPLLNGSDFTTHIRRGRGTAAFDEFGNAKYTSRKTVASGDGVLMNASEKISQIADRLALPKTVVDRANNLVKVMLQDGKKLKGRSTDAMNAILSACLCIASRQEGVPQTFKEVSAVSKSTKKEIVHAFKLVQGTLDISVEAITTGDVMSRFCSLLGLSNTVRDAATAVAKAAEDLEIVTGRSPSAVAAAAIYMVSQVSEFKRSPEEISKVAGVSDVTVRQVYKLMYSRAGELFPKDFVFFTPIDMLPVA